MRNRQLSERNRKHRLLGAARDVMRLEPDERDEAIRDLRESWDWQHATRVTRGIVDEFIELWQTASGEVSHAEISNGR